MRPQFVGRIGSLDDPNQALMRVGQVLIGPGERLFVSQPSDDRILVFDSAMTVPEVIGRRGQGPGEFGSLHAVGLLQDTLWAFDSSVPRFSFFSMDGELLGTRPWGTETFSVEEVLYVPRVPISIVLLPRGEALITPGMMIRGQAPGAGIRSEVMRTPILRVGGDLEIQDTLIWTINEGTTVGISRGGDVSSFSVPFGDEPLYALVPNGEGIVVVDRRRPSPGGQPRFGITLMSPTGDTTFARSIPYEPVPLTEVALNEVVSKVRPYPPPDRGGLSRGEIKEALADNDLVPESHVPVTEVVGTQDGRVWVKREEVGRDSVVWNVFDSRGNPTATVLLSADHEIKAGNRDLLVTLERDEFDVPYLVMFRLGSD